MNSNLTEIVFILDKSGSMAGLESDTVGGFNGMIEKQKKEEGRALVTTVLFSNETQIIHDRLDLEQISPLTEKEYRVGGCTALIDAIGETVRHVADIHRYARPEDVPQHTVFVITTDGLENASHRFTSDEVKKMVEDQKKKGWEFLFLGANIDAVETARRFGIDEERAVNYCSDSRGTAVNYRVLGKAMSAIRRDEKLAPCWAEEIQADYESRTGSDAQNKGGNLSPDGAGNPSPAPVKKLFRKR